MIALAVSITLHTLAERRYRRTSQRVRVLFDQCETLVQTDDVIIINTAIPGLYNLLDKM